MSKNNSRIRLRVLLGAILLVGGIFIAKLFFLQIVKGEEYALVADRQYIKSATTFFNRGSIYFQDRKGNLVSAATLKQEFLLTINPRMIEDKEKTYQALNQIFSIEHEEWLSKFSRAGSLYQEIKAHLTQEEADKIKALDLKGVFLIKEKIRFYPASRTASHVLGFMAYQDEEYGGRYGLEKYYESVLNHQETGSFASFFAEIFVDFGETLFTEGEPNKEGDLILTIEPVVQNTLERELKIAIDKWQADAGGAIIMDPQTGEIVAMAAWPDFNPGEKQGDISVLPNPLVENVYEMGSVIKPLTLAAGFDAGAITPDTTYEDKGHLVLNGRTIYNYDKRGRGVVPMREVIYQSLNTGTVFTQQQMGRDTFRKYMLAYGLGEKTGIDLPGEVSGLVRNLESKEEVDYATVSFGQGIAVTPIETIRAFASIANGGKLVRPHVVKKIRFDDGEEYLVQPEIQRQVLGRKATEDMTQIMISVVDNVLGGGKYSMDNYSIAAKTGTAQMVDASHGNYYEDRFLHSFFGFYPAHNPKFVSLMYVVYPKGAKYSSETMSEPFMNMTKFMINYYELPPDRTGADKKRVSILP